MADEKSANTSKPGAAGEATPPGAGDPSGSTTTVGPTITIRGKLKSDEDLVVKGRIDAQITSSKGLFIENSGVIRANMNVASARVSGILLGDIQAEGKIEIASDGRMIGDMLAPRIVIQDGAAFRGRIDMPNFDSGERGTAPASGASSGFGSSGSSSRSGGLAGGASAGLPAADASDTAADTTADAAPEATPAQVDSPPAPTSGGATSAKELDATPDTGTDAAKADAGSDASPPDAGQTAGGESPRSGEIAEVTAGEQGESRAESPDGSESERRGFFRRDRKKKRR